MNVIFTLDNGQKRKTILIIQGVQPDVCGWDFQYERDLLAIEHRCRPAAIRIKLEASTPVTEDFLKIREAGRA